MFLTVILEVFGSLLSNVLFKELIVINAVTTIITLAGITPLGKFVTFLLNCKFINIPAHIECNP